jgi:hypothetical protein
MCISIINNNNIITFHTNGNYEVTTQVEFDVIEVLYPCTGEVDYHDGEIRTDLPSLDDADTVIAKSIARHYGIALAFVINALINLDKMEADPRLQSKEIWGQKIQ